MFRKIYNTWIQDESSAEIFRFFVTGVISNALGYLVFLFALYVLGVGHKTAVTVLFAIGLAINFSVNRKWTFKSRGAYSHVLLKFIVVYLVGYCLNILILTIFVDHLEYSASLVQLVAIGFLAVYYFITNKFYIHC